MLRPREALARADAAPPLRPDRWPDDAGRGRTIAVIDGVPDLEALDLEGGDLEVIRIGVEPDAPPDEHATHAASLLVDARIGVVPRARLLAAGVTASDGRIAAAAVAEAIGWAIDRGAEILVIPLGDHADDAAVERAIDRAIARGRIVVAAAGNAHPRPLMFPARRPGVVAVGACDESGALLEGCSRTPRLDLVVPAREVIAAVARGREAPRSGTSVAAALAGGLLALDPAGRRRSIARPPPRGSSDAPPCPSASTLPPTSTIPPASTLPRTHQENA
ncbi:MAG: S8 family serine peptidase [Nannocystaceae bacterium]